MLIRSRAWGFIRSGLNGHYGVRPADLGTGGDFPNILSDSFDSPADDDVEMVPVVTTAPLQGTFALYTDASHTHGPITGSDPWVAELWYHRPGESTVLEGADSPLTVTDEGGAATPGLTFAAGSISFSPAVQPTDRKLYLASSGTLQAKATPASGDRLISIVGGAWQAGAPA